jgi:hypothetical protein
MLLEATAGRYYQVAGQDLFNENYATKPNVTNEQKLVGINFNNGQSVAGKLAYQSPCVGEERPGTMAARGQRAARPGRTNEVPSPAREAIAEPWIADSS